MNTDQRSRRACWTSWIGGPNVSCGSESLRSHRSFTAKIAKNAKTITKNIALLSHHAISSHHYPVATTKTRRHQAGESRRAFKKSKPLHSNETSNTHEGLPSGSPQMLRRGFASDFRGSRSRFCDVLRDLGGIRGETAMGQSCDGPCDGLGAPCVLAVKLRCGSSCPSCFKTGDPSAGDCRLCCGEKLAARGPSGYHSDLVPDAEAQASAHRNHHPPLAIPVAVTRRTK